MNAVIMDNALIEEDSIVGAGSVVTKGKKISATLFDTWKSCKICA